MVTVARPRQAFSTVFQGAMVRGPSASRASFVHTAPSRGYDGEAAEVFAGRMHTGGGPGGFATGAEVQAVDPAHGSP